MNLQSHSIHCNSKNLVVSIISFVLIAGLLWGASGGVSVVSAAGPFEETAGNKLEFSGVIETLPSNGLEGTWFVSGHTIYVDSSTKIKRNKGEIAVGLRVDVEATQTADGTLRATRIIALDDGDDADDENEVEIRGIVLLTPSTLTGLGEWRIQKNRNHAWRVMITVETKLELPLPLIGDWVEVQGVAQPDGSILADKLRLDDYAESEVVVRLEEGANATAVADRYQLLVRQTLMASANIHLFVTSDKTRKTKTLVERLQADAEVRWAELNYRGGIPVADPYDVWKWGGTEPDGYVNQQAFSQIHLPAAHPLYTGKGVIVAVLDTGASLDHPQLAGKFLPGRDFVADDNNPSEEGDGIALGHGTHVSGIISHMAPDSRILPLRVLDASGRGDTFVVAYAIEWAVGQGADVINLSLGTVYDSKVLHESIEYATAQGVLVVAAAGNEGGDAPQYPAAYAETLAVTAVDAGNHKARFANFNSWVDVAAPGVGITSTIIGPEGNGFASWSGTSMATSFVSGAAALGKSKWPGITAAALQSRLIDTAVDIDSVNRDYAEQVGKLINTSAALGVPAVTIWLYIPVVTRR